MKCDKISNKEIIMAVFIGFFVFLVAFLMGGCAIKEPIVKIKTQEVFVPIKCEVKKPIRPDFSENVIGNIAHLAEYTQKLEIALNKCAK